MKKSLAMTALALATSFLAVPAEAQEPTLDVSRLTRKPVFISPGVEEGLYLAGRLAFTPAYYNFNLTPKVVPVHQYDAGFLSGSTAVSENDGLSLNLRAGLEVGYDFGKLEVNAGADVEINTLGNGDDRDSVAYNIIPQANDRRGYGGSCVFVELSPETTAVLPFVGARVKLVEGIHAGLEASLVNRNFTRTWGHHRYGKEQAIGSENLNAKALRITARLLFGEDDEKAKIGLEFSRAKYDLTGSNGNEGTISENSIGLFLVRQF